MANRKKEVYKPKPMTEGKRNLIQGLLQEYDIQSADDIQEALKCFLQALFGQSCKTFLDIIASPNWTKLQSLDWQLSCQPHSHCRPYLVVTA